MTDSARQSVPVFRQSDYVVWTLDAEGCFASVFGSGLGSLQLESRDILGRHVTDLYTHRPDLMRMFQRLLSGHRVATTVEVGGALWRVEAEPMFRGEQVVGASGISVAIEMETIDRQPRRREWTLRSLPLGLRCPFVPGTTFVKVEGTESTAFGGLMSDAEFMAIMIEFGRYLDLVRDSGPPSPSPRPFYPRLLP